MSFRTERDVARLKLPAGKADAYFFDGEGGGLSVRIQGERKSWVAHFASPDGRRRRISLGPVKGLPLAEARKEAGRVVAGARLGRDPLAERDRRKGEAETRRQEAARTFGRVADLYLAARQKPDPTGGKRYGRALRPKSLAEITRTLTKHAAEFRGQPLGSVTASAIKLLLARAWAGNGPVAASRVRAHLSAFYGWCLAKGYATANPVAEIPGGDEAESRERTLTDRELAAVWRATAELPVYGDILRLLMLTGARRNEIGGMAWAEIDLEAATWRLPGERLKNGKAHTVALSPPAVAILERQERRGPFVFGRRAGFQGWSACKRRLDDASGVEAWTVHDTRRTVATRLQALGVRLEVAERVLGHAATAGSRAGVIGVYQRHTFDDEARDAWHRWSDRLQEIAGEREATSVVRLRA